jgi:TonB family protein
MLTAEPENRVEPGAPITLSLEKADLNDVLTTFSEVTGYEILAEPGISGSVTTELDGVPWDQALSKILQQQGLEWEIEGHQIIVHRHGGERLVPPAPPKAPSTPHVTGRLDGAEVFRYVEGGPITPPEVISKVVPSYPVDSKTNKIMGAVVAELLIDDTGAVREVEIKKSPADDLAMAAIDALEQWRFAPATMDGKPVAVRYIVTVMFKLE